MKHYRIALALLISSTLLPIGITKAVAQVPVPNAYQDHDRDDDRDHDKKHEDHGKHKGWDKHKDKDHDRDDRDSDRRDDRDRDHDRYQDQRGGYNQHGGYNQGSRNPGFNLGITEGRNDGAHDRSLNRKFHYGPGWNHPDRGYVNSYGDKNVYKAQYREGYKAGYEQGYYGRR